MTIALNICRKICFYGYTCTCNCDVSYNALNPDEDFEHTHIGTVNVYEGNLCFTRAVDKRGYSMTSEE